MKKVRRTVEVCYSPNDYPLYKNDHEIVVIIDVLRATSAIVAGMASGLKSIIPVSTLEEAFDYKKKGYIVAAERGGMVVEGFAFGNSPFSFMDPKLKGKSIVLSTTNGTRAINTPENKEVIIASLINAKAVSKYLMEQNKNVLLLASGWKDKFNLEDTICAGAIADELVASGLYSSEEDSSIAAKYLYQSASVNFFGFLKSSSHRRRLKKLNLNEDIKFCLTPNQFDIVPVLNGKEIVIL
jgi:2-phosphosulfolactate phosphatase